MLGRIGISGIIVLPRHSSSLSHFVVHDITSASALIILVHFLNASAISTGTSLFESLHVHTYGDDTASRHNVSSWFRYWYFHTRNYCLRIQSKVYSERYLHTEEEQVIRRGVNCREANASLGHDRIRMPQMCSGFLKEAVSQIGILDSIPLVRQSWGSRHDVVIQSPCHWLTPLYEEDGGPTAIRTRV